MERGRAVDHRTRVNAHANEILARYELPISTDPRFSDGPHLLDRFRRVVKDVANNACNVRALHEAHNELCVAEAILKGSVTALAYEPQGVGTSKTIDFRATTMGNQTLFVDVKTIHPDEIDRWDQFERGQNEGWVPPSLDLSKAWLGGELWHDMSAARSRMLEYTIELEQKLPAFTPLDDGALVMMLFCGNGFDWQLDQLEDFVGFYLSGRHRFDDDFVAMERHFMGEKSISLARTISRFGYVERALDAIEPSRCSWHVRPPAEPSVG